MNDKRNSVIPLLGGISIGSLVPILGFGLGIGDRLWTPTKATAEMDRRLTSIEEQVKRMPIMESKIDALLTRGAQQRSTASRIHSPEIER